MSINNLFFIIEFFQMIKIIVDSKGTGKTKKLIDSINARAEESNGNVVCSEKGMKLTYDITHKARLIDGEHYGISTYDELYSFISGVLAGDHDITDVYVDGTLKMGGKDYESLVHFLDRLSAVVEEENVNMLLTISCDESELPEGIHHVAEIVK